MTYDSVGLSDLFTCQRCGDCCKGYGGTYITENEIDNICRYLGLKRKKFIRRYCQMSGDRPVIAQGGNGYCIFWNKACTIHAVKPRMCKNWPFIESILIHAKNWQTMAASCRGMRADFSDNQIQGCISEFLQRKK
ncbi:MAG: YkgJ family cysteine cluster protein [Desulfobacterales bacterium]|nr:YkgJ family cysteine cluster protein [Desulfobacterales bacterium]